MSSELGPKERINTGGDIKDPSEPADLQEKGKIEESKRFPVSSEFRSIVLAELSGKVPETPMDRTFARHTELKQQGTLARNKIRREGVNAGLAAMVEDIRRSVPEQIIIEDTPALESLLKDAPIERITGEAIAADLLGDRGAVRVIFGGLYDRKIFSEKDLSTIAERKGWDSESIKDELSSFFGIFGVRMMRRVLETTPEGDPQRSSIPLSWVVDFALKLVKSVASIYREEKSIIPRKIIDETGVRDVLVDKNEEAYGHRDGKTESDWAKLSEAESRPTKEKLEYMRTTSDEVRFKVIPELVAKNATLRDAFWAIHRAHFREPFTAQVGTDVRDGYTRSVASDQFYDRNVGRRRDLDVASFGAYHVLTPYLDRLEEVFFTNLDKAVEGLKNEEDFLELTAKAIMFIMTSHLPFDGRKRTTEDFIVFLGEKLGYSVTLATSGYRFASSLTTEYSDALKGFFKEKNVKAASRLGVDIEGDSSYNSVVKRIVEETGISKAEAEQRFYAEIALETSRMSESLVDPSASENIKQEYAAYGSLVDLWRKAKEQKYIQVPADIADECDFLAAKIITPRHLKTFEWEIKRFYDYVPEHLRNDVKSFVHRLIAGEKEEARTLLDMLQRKRPNEPIVEELSELIDAVF